MLRAHAVAGCADDGGVEAETLGGLDAGAGSRDAEAELVVGDEGGFIYACCGVEDAFGVGGVDLEAGVVG